MIIKLNSVWRYHRPNVAGPENSMAPNGQLHEVVASSAMEIITAGIPYGHGGSFCGTPQDFLGMFTFFHNRK